jgi:hypothetical protein
MRGTHVHVESYGGQEPPKVGVIMSCPSKEASGITKHGKDALPQYAIDAHTGGVPWAQQIPPIVIEVEAMAEFKGPVQDLRGHGNRADGRSARLCAELRFIDGGVGSIERANTG